MTLPVRVGESIALPGTWIGTEKWWCASVTVGPFSLWLRRVWPARRTI